jgi:hypothetical protein
MGTAETDTVLERIEEMLANAKPIPLTDQARIEMRQAQLLLSELRDHLAAERRDR